MDLHNYSYYENNLIEGAVTLIALDMCDLIPVL
jgi:hypothetical protein